MIKERTLISGDLKSKVKQLMEYAVMPSTTPTPAAL